MLGRPLLKPVTGTNETSVEKRLREEFEAQAAASAAEKYTSDPTQLYERQPAGVEDTDYEFEEINGDDQQAA